MKNAYEDQQRAAAYSRIEVLETLRPLGNPEDPCEWVSETEIAPWVIHVLAPRAE